MDDKPNSKKRILWAAGEIFSEIGYRQATIRWIVKRAGVNVASINYYFRSKDNLYLETLKYWKGIAFEKYPRELGTSLSDPPEARLNRHRSMPSLTGRARILNGLGCFMRTVQYLLPALTPRRALMNPA